jgi:hypothetical protein
MNIFEDIVITFTEILHINLVLFFSEKASWKAPV